ncbi:MAG: type I DNA topoisomerase [Candidatus Auribacter fodinae]|jgi:DNA topoisomerase-1|uniref:DNA topoisomerase 1 n=1 Tax=Candidatus Auribacter fodinae TaxID=2093366 RepID=A0A3A4R9H0_9BACT|nr:MAG: type I DNA topoisomerase [Candidatus Auribacter fodinae]
MAESLVIVESPAKAKTINKYLGSDFEVKSSVGHIRDLPPSKLGIDIEKDFEPDYIVIKGKEKVISELQKSAKGKKNIYLAPDPDREGEAIAWHIAHELGKSKAKVFRVTFNEITKQAIKEAFEHPTEIDLNKVNAQQARRILDRLVGYQISPLLWGRLWRGLSAGRVQSVAMKMICDREAEILAFKKEEYWSITGMFQTGDKAEVQSKLLKIDDKNIKIPDEKTSNAILSELKKESFAVTKIVKTDKKRHPAPPFITSTLQQEASRHFGFNAQRTMRIAQTLYEGVELGSAGSTGLITYMRTDSTRIADVALHEVRSFINNEYGKKYLPAKANYYKSKKSAQEAHEAIRPTDVTCTPESVKAFLTPDQFKLYGLIWKRFVASQMESAIIAQTTIDITGGKYLFRATGSIIKFDGFMKLYLEKKDEDADSDADTETEEKDALLPDVQEGSALTVKKFVPKQHFTQPPPRYSEATLIKALEENGIGRPSTYAAIMAKIQDRNYTSKLKGKLYPTELGSMVTQALTVSFNDIVNEKFTASMEESLDTVEKGGQDWHVLLKDFYASFKENLDAAYKSMKIVAMETEFTCAKCGKKMVVRLTKNGPFLACSAYPDCKFTMNYKKDPDGKIVPIEDVEETTEEKCDKCGSPLVVKEGRFGKFLACSGYPDCKFTRPVKDNKTGTPCPQEGCDGELVQRRGKKGRSFYGCSNYPQCRFTATSLKSLTNQEAQPE